MPEMESHQKRETGDVFLAPNEWLLVRDRTKGDVNVHVGPCKLTISETDRPVIFDEKTKRFLDTSTEKAIAPFVTAPEGYYIVLKNPAFNDKGDPKHPGGQGKASPADLTVGRKVNTPGPASFPLYPGQMAKVIKGHNLRSNQYLIIRVYDEDAARKNWKSAVIKPQLGAELETTEAQAIPDLTMGKLLVIKGTEVAFYMPPTGIEVVVDAENQHVRSAVTLERLEYCLLRDEGGNKRYEKGPAVVFPRPTEIFSDREIEDKDGKKSKTRKFRAIELNENSGIYVKITADHTDYGKITADHTDESGVEHKQGDELFITGKQQMIYFPREEHAIVKYDNNEIHYGIAIPAGEARYVLDRNTGSISLVKGPKIFLPDPRSQVIVRRLLDFKTCSMLYPGNQAALEHNAALAGVDFQTYMASSSAIAEAAAMALLATPGGAAFTSNIAGAFQGATGPQGPMGHHGIMGTGGMSYNVNSPGVFALASLGDNARDRGLNAAPARGFSGDTFIRKTQFSEPRTITLPTKFDGAVSCDIWPGYAMMLVRKSGERRVVQGPATVLLEYDEQPQVLSLSRGKPKTTDNLLRTAFLLTTTNKVSDLVEVETSDFCKLKVKVSYRVNFTGDKPEKWFSVENYTKFLTDHLRSRLRSATKKVGVEKFYASAEDFVRAVVMGAPINEADGKLKGRPGTSFEENGMHVYDVEVLNVELDNKEIATDLSNSQKEVIKHALTLASSKRALEFTKEAELIKQQTNEAIVETNRKRLLLQQQELTSKLEFDLANLAANAKTSAEQSAQAVQMEKAKGAVNELALASEKAKVEQDIALEATRVTLRKEWLAAEVDAVVNKAKAITPDLVAALEAFGDRALIEKVSEAMAPLAMIQKTGVMDVLGNLLQGTELGKRLLPEVSSNGTSAKTPTARA
jgi:major vault protein